MVVLVYVELHTELLLAREVVERSEKEKGEELDAKWKVTEEMHCTSLAS
jgi:hypothetical protein